MRETYVVPNRHAWRSSRTEAAFEGAQGRLILTIEQVAAQLAGGFLREIDIEELKAVILGLDDVPLGDLDEIRHLPGFPRAAAQTLLQAWSAGIELKSEAEKANDQTASTRLAALALLEGRVLVRLSRNQLRPIELVCAAIKRAEFAKQLFGRIKVLGRTEMSPVWRPLLKELSYHSDVIWVAGARESPAWLGELEIPIEVDQPSQPSVGRGIVR